jgi:hypothetical protein
VERVRLRETGVTGTILAAKAGNGVDVDRVLASFDFGPPETANDGWFISAQRRDVDAPTNDFGGLIGALGGPAIVVRVLRDDWAYLIASAPGSEAIAMVMTPDALRAEVGPLGLENGRSRRSKRASAAAATGRRHRSKRTKPTRDRD